MENKKYFLGFDAGTDSVGYAVTDETYSLLKFHGEPMWGVTLFEEAQLNTDRRMFRTSRRRTERRRQRIRLLQELFANEIAQVDEKFFIRLQSSRLYREEAGFEGTLFPDEGTITDKIYHRCYPTIHHLIMDLIQSKEKHDPRLVYLACAWLISHRGHFLSEISVDRLSELTDFNQLCIDLTEYIRQADEAAVVPWGTAPETMREIADILTKRNTVTGKYKSLCQTLFRAPKAPKDYEGFPYNLDVFLKLLCGSKVKAVDLFENEEYASIESFALDSDDEKLAGVFSQLGEDSVLLVKMKAINDCALLANSLNEGRYISSAKIKQYEQHKKDLLLLKRIIRKYAPAQYNAVFRAVDKDNYAAYSYHCKTEDRAKLSKVDKTKFNDFLKKVLEPITPDAKDKAAFEEMKDRVAAYAFLPKQKDGDNRVIPHQLYQYELRAILANASTYLPFLSEKDENGISVSEKIESVFTFKIPYFVGPLNPYCKDHAWVVRKPGKNGPILPWNFFEMVDEKECEHKFIRRMTNRCTYLPDEDVLPKDSLLYHKFTVLNEINNLEINGTPITVETKQGIYNDLFLQRRKVTVKAIRDYLASNGQMEKTDVLTGVDETIKSDLKPWLDFGRLMAMGKLTEDQVEKIIEHRTYAEEKSRFTKWLREEYAFLPEEDVTYISNLSYKDFGRLSRRFLNELEGCAVDSPTGELQTILAIMWETNNNLMEILSDRFTFAKAVKDEQNDSCGSRDVSLEKRLNAMYISNAVKRPVIRTLEIAKEVTKAIGNPPTKIFVEMARGGKKEDKGKRTKSRRQQILELYDKCADEDVRHLRTELEAMGEAADSRLQGDRLFLYYMQLGKCMYSGESIDLQLLSGKMYNIEHIYPQAFVKDDSILNNEVLVKSELNGQKDDDYPINKDIRHRMAGFWAALHEKNLITDEKYKRLTRTTPFSDDEKFGFINRQLTETSQATKAIASLLKEYYPESEIVYVKARLTSEFRQEFDLLKSRMFNDLHHAKDAYLNIVTGNVYNCKFTKNFYVNREYSIKTKTVFSHAVSSANWEGEQSIAKVKAIAVKNTAHLTKYAFCRHGGFFDQMPVKAAPGLIPLKKGLPTEKYGGYNKPAVSFFALAKYQAGKKTETMLIPVELLYRDEFLASKEKATEYAKKRIGQITGKTIDTVTFPMGMRVLKINTVLSLDGFKVCIAGSSNGGKNVSLSSCMQFAESHEWETYLKRLEMLCEKVKKNPHYWFDETYDKVTKEKNIQLYRVYVEKMQKTIYKKRPNCPVDTLVSGQKAFEKLDEISQAKTLLSIHQIFGRISGGTDLSAINGVSHAGATAISSSLSNWKKYYNDVRILDMSVSGLWKKSSDENLLKLL